MGILMQEQALDKARMEKYTLKKLPMWGAQVEEGEINFQWPTQEILDQMEPNVTLTSLTFKCLGIE